MKGGLLDQETVDFLSRQKIALFVVRNLSKRPKVSWKMKKQKRSLCIIVISITRTLWKRFYTCCLEVGIFQVLLMEALRSALDVSSKLVYTYFFLLGLSEFYHPISNIGPSIFENCLNSRNQRLFKHFKLYPFPNTGFFA